MHQDISMNITQSSEVLIGTYDQLQNEDLFSSMNCTELVPKYLPRPIDCGFDGYFCTAKSHKKVVICHWRIWIDYFEDENINPTLCTHLVYHGAHINSETNKIDVANWKNKARNVTNTGYRYYLKYVTNSELKVR